MAVLLVVVGLAVLGLGAELLARGGAAPAARLGIPPLVVGLTVVSTLRGDRDIAVGNLIGSSVYHLALILGITSLVAPLEVTRDLVRFDLPLMALVALVLLPVFATGRRVSRGEGVAFVSAYVLYLGVVVVTRT